MPEETKPAAVVPTVDVRELVLSDGPFGPVEVQKILDAIAADFAQYRVLRDAVQQLELREDLGPAGNARLGVCYFLLGRYNLATQTLERADGGALALFYLAKAAFALEKYDKAIELYQSAAKAGYDAGLCTLARAEAQRYAHRNREAQALLDELSGPIEQTAEYLYQRGASVAAGGGNPLEAVRLYERAVEVDPKHVGALFGLAIENDRRGNDDLALELYEKSSQRFPPHMGTLLNLGLLYEDRNQFDKARQCYQRILEIYPNNGRARLFQKDASASSEMIYDEDAQRKRDRLSQLLSIPVTDFELSVRSRNCLQKMGIGTLGDLAATTEQDLLSSKNFGETSLIEIKEMLSSKGLALGQFAGEKMRTAEVFEPQAMSPDDQALLNRPIADLQLSVRARKCMVRLGVSTIGELVRHTGDELLECKNFGVTSLNEVREKLTNHALKLRGD
jgi:DNA-directed RNA polymerase subunit alpha